jgi:rare lipoprotein A
MATVYPIVPPTRRHLHILAAPALALMLCALPACALHDASWRGRGTPDAGTHAEPEGPAAEAPGASRSVAFYEVGTASYYGRRFHGRRTANGETFDMHELTAAHRRLSFGTVLRVTNLANGHAVMVRVNDRGPYIRGRVLDLSHAAAQRIGMVHSGLARVRIEVVAAD